MTETVFFVGAGPGAPDLLTIRGQKLLSEADVVVYAGSLVNPELLKNCRGNCVLHDSAFLTLKEVLDVMIPAAKAGQKVVRLHTGDPSLFGAVREQMDALSAAGISFEICPGVSSFSAAAAALKAEYTLPGVSQTLILSRIEGRTPVPERERIEALASHQASMALFLSAGQLQRLSERLLEGGYPPETPAALVYKASWPEEQVIRTTIEALPEEGKKAGITKTALVLVGQFLGDRYQLSRLYAPEFTTEYRHEAGSAGSLHVIGIGPGGSREMTGRALRVLETCHVVAGYRLYLDLIRDLLKGKQLIENGMRGEEARCRAAVEAALSGEQVAVISSGDAGVYGMASLILELAEQHPELPVEIVPGVTACLSAGALLGAPLSNDFACVSLSDLLTPWETIEKRLRAAAAGDFCIALYNPGSRTRTEHLKKACDILLEMLPPNRVCGIARAVGREGEEIRLKTLKELREAEVDMLTTVIVGNSGTRVIGGRMVTPRGYLKENTATHGF